MSPRAEFWYGWVMGFCCGGVGMGLYALWSVWL